MKVLVGRQVEFFVLQVVRIQDWKLGGVVVGEVGRKRGRKAKVKPLEVHRWIMICFYIIQEQNGFRWGVGVFGEGGEYPYVHVS